MTEAGATGQSSSDSPEVSRIRSLLREACEECPACGAEQADLAPTAEFAAWLAGGNQHRTVKSGWPAWHLDPAWRTRMGSEKVEVRVSHDGEMLIRFGEGEWHVIDPAQSLTIARRVVAEQEKAK